jgi:hypothetical protein
MLLHTYADNTGIVNTLLGLWYGNLITRGAQILGARLPRKLNFVCGA